jgi:predicted acetyltransferase
MSRIYGLATIRAAAQEMLRVIGKFSHLHDEVIDEDKGKFNLAIKKIFEGCTELLQVRYKKETDSSDETTRRTG